VEPSAVIALSSTQQVDGIVVGRTTQIGNHLSVDVRLLSGASGELLDTYIAEIARGGETAAVETLAAQVIEGALSSFKVSDTAEGAPMEDGRSASKLRVFNGEAPISIKSDFLEATQSNGKRRLEFTGNVRVNQEGVKIMSDQLIADYPKGSSQPSKLVATGSVQVFQGVQEARCDRGTYERGNGILLCCGNAELRDGSNRVQGSCIEFDLTGETVRIKDAKVNIAPETSDGDSSESEGGAQ
jgi:lipopolysaccharide transport protein LptA